MDSNFDDDNDSIYTFTYFFNSEPVTCRVETSESYYGIHFDGELVGVIKINEDGLWDAQGGSLNFEVANEIGKRIQGHYD